MKNIKQKSKELTPAFYMTIVSIIQSFALGFLLTSIGDSAARLLHTNLIAFVGWFQAAAVFQVIVMTWHVNVQHATIFARVYDVADSYIPFLFAIPEYSMIVCIKSGNVHWWFLWMALLVAMTFWAFLDNYVDTQKEPENAEVFAKLRLYRVGILAYLGSGAALFLLMGLFTPAGTSMQLLLAGIVNVMLVIFTFAHHFFCWRRVISD